MRRIKLIAISIFLLSTNLITGQTLFARGDIHKIYSFNKMYFLRSIPNEDAERTKIGNTIFYKTDSTELYKFPRYFEFGYFDQQVFLNNDGSTITDIANGDLDFYNYQQKCITIYKNGKLFKEYALHDIIDCDSKDHRECKLFYFAKDAVEKVSYESNRIRTIVFKKNATNFEKLLTRNPLYQCNDTLLVFCKLGQIIRLNLSTGELTKEKSTVFDTKNITGFDTLQVQSYKVINPTASDEFPKMANGKKTEERLADFIGMKVSKERDSEKYKIYDLYISAHIDIEGNAHVTEIKNYRFNGIPAEAKIYSFFYENKFETKNIPTGVDGWIFRSSVMLINKDLKIAEREKQEEIEKRQQKHKEYIERKKLQERKRIEECSKVLDLELNKEITSDEVGIIKNLKSIDEKSICHFKFPNDTSFNMDYLNTYKDLYEKFPVSDQLDKLVNFELRLWVSGMSGTTGLFRLKYDNNGNWNAEKYIVEYQKVIYSKITLKENWDKIFDRLLLNNILSLPDNPKLEGKKFVENGVTYTSEVAIADGTGYKVELLSRENNRQYSISNPIGYYKHYTDSKPLKDFNRILEILSAVYDYGFE